MSGAGPGRARWRAAWEWLRHNDQVSLPLLAAVVGVLAGYGAIAFRLAIDSIQFLFYGSASEEVLSMATQLECGGTACWHRPSAGSASAFSFTPCCPDGDRTGSPRSLRPAPPIPGACGCATA